MYQYNSSFSLGSSDCLPTSFDRQCMRCMLYDLEGEADDSYLAKDRFTRSFSPQDSFEDIFSIGDECDGETRVLFCKSLNVTSDEDEDRKGTKRTYEQTRDSQIFEPRKRPYKSENDPSKSRKSSNYSLRSLRSFKSPMSVISGNISISRRCKPPSMRSSPPISVSSTRTNSDNDQPKRRSQMRNMTKTKKNWQKENQSNDENEDITVFEKTVITLTSSDNYILGNALEQLGVCSSSRLSTKKNKQKLPALEDVKKYSGVTLENDNRNEQVAKRISPPREAYKKLVPTSKVEISSLPTIEEKMESESSRSSRCSRSNGSNSFSLTESYTSEFSESSDVQNPILSVVKMNFDNMRVRRKARLVARLRKPEENLYPNSCLKKGTSKTSKKKSVSFHVDGDECLNELVQKKSARLEKCPPLSLAQSQPPNLNHRLAQILTAPVVLSIQKTYPQKTEMEDEVLNAMVPNVRERLCSQILRNISPYGPGMYALFPRNVLSPPSVTITELKGKDPAQFPTATTMGSYSHENQSLGQDSSTIIRAISDFLVNMKNEGENAYMISKKTISQGPANGNAKRQLRRKESLEERRKLIRLKLKERSKHNDEGLGKTEKSNDIRAISRIITKEQLHATRSSKTRRSGKPQVTRNLKAVAIQNCQESSSTRVLPVLRRSRARSGNESIFQRTVDVDCQDSSRTNSTTEAGQTPYVSLGSSGESYQTPSTRRPQSLSPVRPPSRKPHLTLASRRAVSAHAKSNDKPAGQPRTPLTMQMTNKPDPETTSTIRNHLGSEIPKPDETEFEELPEKTRTVIDEKLSLLITKKLAGHPLRNKTLAEFKKERERQFLNNRHKIAYKNVSPSSQNKTL